MEEKAIARYMRKRMSGGRGAFARAVDYVVLRLLAFAAAYLLFLPRFESRATAVLLSAIVLALFMLVLHMANEIRYARFSSRELIRVRRQLLQDALLLLDMQTLLPLVSARCPEETTPVVLQRALPVDANQLLALVRTHRNCGELHVFSCSAYDETAKTFALRTNGLLALHAPEELYSAASDAGMQPSEDDAKKSILAQAKRERRQRRGVPALDLAVGGARKYALIALVLTGLSFATDYALYYRMLAGFCMTLAAIGMWKGRADAGR